MSDLVFPTTPPSDGQVADAESAAALMIRAAIRIDSYALHEVCDYDRIARPLSDLLRAGAVDATAIGPDFRLVDLARAIAGEDVS